MRSRSKNLVVTAVAVLFLLACQARANIIFTLHDGTQIEMESFQIFYPGTRCRCEILLFATKCCRFSINISIGSPTEPLNKPITAELADSAIEGRFFLWTDDNAMESILFDAQNVGSIGAIITSKISTSMIAFNFVVCILVHTRFGFRTWAICRWF